VASRSTSLARLVGAADSLFTLLILVGALAAIAGWLPGIYLALAGFFGYLADHLIVGVAGYREVMRRPWPKVRPLDDDDDW
jgi:hypothetical protein